MYTFKRWDVQEPPILFLLVAEQVITKAWELFRWLDKVKINISIVTKDLESCIQKILLLVMSAWTLQNSSQPLCRVKSEQSVIWKICSMEHCKSSVVDFFFTWSKKLKNWCSHPSHSSITSTCFLRKWIEVCQRELDDSCELYLFDECLVFDIGGDKSLNQECIL